MNKPKKRMIFLVLYFIIAVIAGFVIVNVTGSTYTLASGLGFNSNEVIKNIDVTYSNENVIEMTGHRLEDVFWGDKQLIVTFKSVSPGVTKVSLSITVEGNDELFYADKFKFRVNRFGAIIDETNGTNFEGYPYIIILTTVSFIIFAGIMIWSFIEAWKKAWFSQTMIAYGGLSLFSTALLVFLIYKILNNAASSMHNYIALILDIGWQFFSITTPLMLIMAIAVSISNIWLLKHEGFRPVNGLGIAISILWLAGTLLTRINFYYIDSVTYELFYLAKLILIYIISYFECMLMSTMVCAYLASKFKPPLNKDYIIILGCAIRNDGSLTPILKGRVDSALKYEREQYEKTGKHAVFVPSGGQGSDEIISEGEAMERYLIAEGIPADRILREDKSVNTYQNMEFSKKIIDGHNAENTDVNIAFSTTNYHIFRGYILSKKIGFTAQGISAKTKWYFFPNAFLREFIGLLVDKKWKHLLYILTIIIGFIMLRFLN